MEFKDKIAIVTGASSGIGLAAAKLLTQKGVKVALVSRSNKKLEEIAETLKNSLAVYADMSKENDIKKMVEKVYEHFGRIDILINNAGVGYDALVEQINPKTYHYLFDLNVLGPLIAIQQVVPIMRSQKEGFIVNISSGTALMALPQMAAYSSLKRALVGISKTANAELKKDNISVSVVYPYITATNFEKNTIKNKKIKDNLENEDFSLTNADSPEFVAATIIEAIIGKKEELMVHEWMGKNT